MQEKSTDGVAAPGRAARGGRLRHPLVLLALIAALALIGGVLGTEGGSSPSRTTARQASGASNLSDPGSGGRSAVAERPGRRPNIVVIMADDMRVDDLRYAPTVRKVLGQGGVTFDNSFSPFPLCCPARASFLSGRYAHNHKVLWHYAPYGFAAFDDSRTIGTSLSAAGYRTAYVGKYLNGYGPMRSLVTGKPSYTYVPAGWSDWYASVDGGKEVGIHGSTYNFFDVPFNINGRIDNTHRGQYGTDVIGAFSRRLITRYARGKQPFFLYTSFVAPHHGGPREPDDPAPFLDADNHVRKLNTTARPDWVKGRFDRIIPRAPGLPKDGGPAEADMSDKPSNLTRFPEPNAAERAALLAVTRQRAEAVYVLDRQVAKIVATLKSTGAWKNTVLMFTSDNGYFLGEHRKPDGKVLAHEPSLRVPFLVAGPGVRAGEHRSDPISTVDLTATVLDIAGARPPRIPDGASRWRSIRQGDQGWATPVVTEAYKSITGRRTDPHFRAGDARTSIGLRTPRYSFTRYMNGQGELYDLLADPGEFENHFSDPAYASLRAELDRLWLGVKDCVGSVCRTPLPDDLAATPRQATHLVDEYWRGIAGIYGY